MLHIKQQTACLCDTEGQGLVEYALILLLVAMAVAATLATFGSFLNGLYIQISAMFP